MQAFSLEVPALVVVHSAAHGNSKNDRADCSNVHDPYRASSLEKHSNPVRLAPHARDVTGRKEFEERRAHQAFHDPLTGLPNRALLLDRLNRGLARTRRGKGRIAALFMDLDDFKVINDSLGHEAGNRLLVGVAERLREAVGP